MGIQGYAGRLKSWFFGSLCVDVIGADIQAIVAPKNIIAHPVLLIFRNLFQRSTKFDC